MQRRAHLNPSATKPAELDPPIARAKRSNKYRHDLALGSRHKKIRPAFSRFRLQRRGKIVDESPHLLRRARTAREDGVHVDGLQNIAFQELDECA